VPEIVLSTHGRYELAQRGGGWELRERVEARRRARWAVGGLLLGAAAVIWDATRHPFAFAPALLGAALVIAGVRKKGRRLVIRDTEIAWGYTADEPLRSGLWPRARIGSVRIEIGSRLADPKLRRRVPQWTVGIRSRDGELHPATFAFSTEVAARTLGETLARHLGVALEVDESASPGGASVKPSRRGSDPRRLGGTAPTPERLDPR
jgi:hypothetical protein